MTRRIYSWACRRPLLLNQNYLLLGLSQLGKSCLTRPRRGRLQRLNPQRIGLGTPYLHGISFYPCRIVCLSPMLLRKARHSGRSRCPSHLSYDFHIHHRNSYHLPSLIWPYTCWALRPSQIGIRWFRSFPSKGFHDREVYRPSIHLYIEHHFWIGTSQYHDGYHFWNYPCKCHRYLH